MKDGTLGSGVGSTTHKQSGEKTLLSVPESIECEFVSLTDFLALLSTFLYLVAKVLGLLDFVVFLVEQAGLQILVGLVLAVQLSIQSTYSVCELFSPLLN